MHHVELLSPSSSPQQYPRAGIEAAPSRSNSHLYHEELKEKIRLNREMVGMNNCFAYPHGESAYKLLALKNRIDAMPDGTVSESIVAGANAAIKSIATAARKDLATMSTEFLTLTDERMLHLLALDHARVLDETENRMEELEANREAFTTMLHAAIDKQGLPLSHEQLDVRLEGLIVGFKSSLNFKGSIGSYSHQTKSVFINSGLSPEELRVTVFHELWHAVSGQQMMKNEQDPFGMEASKVGLKKRYSYTSTNEAFTELMALLMASGHWKSIDFNSDKPLLQLGNSAEETYKLAEGSIYEQEIVSLLNTSSMVPARMYIRAYLAQNNDPLEADPRAGTHAERDLQRAIKVVGGAERIVSLRALDSLFAVGDKDIASDNSLEMFEEDFDRFVAVRPAVSRLRQLAGAKQVEKHSKKYQKMIRRAKAHTANSKRRAKQA